MIAECKDFASRVLFPNTEESDRRKFVMHIVNFTYRGQRKEMHVMDECPYYAIKSVKESIAKLDEAGMEKVVDKS